MHFGELHVFAGANFVITVRHSESPDLALVRQRMESTPGAMDEGAEAVLYAILDAVVDGYKPVVEGIANDIDEIETQVFDGDPKVSRRVYELNREVIEFERAVAPLIGIIDVLSSGFADGYVGEKLQQYLRDVADHVVQAKERIEEFRVLLRDILDREHVARRAASDRGGAAPLGGEQPPGRPDPQDLGVGRHPVRAVADRVDLRHELRLHAGAAPAVGVPVGARWRCSRRA